MSLFEQAKGKAKQAVGDVTDDEQLQREGAAQQEKGAAQTAAAKHRAAAQVHEKQADALSE